MHVSCPCSTVSPQPVTARLAATLGGVEFLSAPWCERLVDLAADGSVGSSAANATIEVAVAGTSEGTRHVTLVFAGGRLHSCTASVAESPADVELKVSAVDAAAILTGRLDANAAFMLGQIKTEGRTGPLLDVLAATKSPAFAKRRAALAAETALAD